MKNLIKVPEPLRVMGKKYEMGGKIIFQSFCILSQKFCVPLKNFAFFHKTIAFHWETLHSLTKALISFFPSTYYYYLKSFSKKSKSFAFCNSLLLTVSSIDCLWIWFDFCLVVFISNKNMILGSFLNLCSLNWTHTNTWPHCSFLFNLSLAL